jgi:hypothetical protein
VADISYPGPVADPINRNGAAFDALDIELVDCFTLSRGIAGMNSAARVSAVWVHRITRGRAAVPESDICGRIPSGFRRAS